MSMQTATPIGIFSVRRRGLPLTLIGLLIAWASQAAIAQDVAEQGQSAAPAEQATAQHTPVRGWQLMTTEERETQRTRMRNAKSEEERAAIRAANHVLMQALAKERGLTLQAAPPPRTGMHRHGHEGKAQGRAKGPCQSKRHGAGNKGADPEPAPGPEERK